MINKTAAHALGYASAEEAVNTCIITRDQKSLPLLVLRKPVDPIIFYHRHAHEYGYYSFNIQSRQGDYLQTLEKIWNKHYPNDAYNYYFWIVSSVSNTDQISCLQGC